MEKVVPNVPRQLRALVNYDVRYVLAGSVAAQAWGAEIGTPGDLDIIPATDEINLRKLQAALSTIEARPFPTTGAWQSGPDGFVWHEYDDDDHRRGSVPPDPDPVSPQSFDSLYQTRFGALDIVPVISGTYEEVSPQASTFTVHGIENVQVMSLEDLLTHLTVPRRMKDATCVAHLRMLQRER